MKTLLVVLAVLALVIVLGGAVNHDSAVSFDYLVGSTAAVSVFWLALAVAAGLLVAGMAGWSLGRTGTSETRGKLERELEATYRRLRECEARLPRGVPPSPEATAASGREEGATAIQPAAADAATAVRPAVEEATTAVRPAGEPPEAPTAS